LENFDTDTDAESVKDFLATVGGPIVLVGHSYGGSVITNAAAGNPNVKALVYVDAAAPDVGETTASLSGANSVLTRPQGELFDSVPISSHSGAAARAGSPMAGRPPLRIGTHGKISRINQGRGKWLARCRYRDTDGVTRIVEKLSTQLP
jgi:pimeloyl-ACP methyl ester carboxylesterase